MTFNKLPFGSNEVKEHVDCPHSTLAIKNFLALPRQSALNPQTILDILPLQYFFHCFAFICLETHVPQEINKASSGQGH